MDFLTYTKEILDGKLHFFAWRLEKSVFILNSENYGMKMTAHLKLFHNL